MTDNIKVCFIRLPFCFLFHLSVRVAGCCGIFSPKGLRSLLGPNPVYSMGAGQGSPWMSCQLIAGPLLMAVAATQGANGTSGAFLGFSILLKDTSTREPGFEPVNFQSLVHQLYPLSYSHPIIRLI